MGFLREIKEDWLCAVNELLESVPDKSHKSVQEEVASSKETDKTSKNMHDSEEDVGIILFNMGAKINGDIETTGSIEMYGTLIGNAVAKETIRAGRGSVVIGDLYANTVIVEGAIKGNIEVEDLVVLTSTAVVMGDVSARDIQIDNGAIIEGRCFKYEDE